MYAAYFGLKDNPFSITPDPGYLYLSPHHQEALAHLLYGTGEGGGFVQLTGEVGTGKTTLIRTLVEQHIEKLDIALCLNPRLTVEELVAGICDELRIAYPQPYTLKSLIDALNAHLLNTHAQGRRTVLIIDEAQSLSRAVLEQVRLLTNLETHRHKLLRIILVGQPELQRLLEDPDLRQLAQRITARYHLMPLSRQETAAYILHRLRVAGGREDLFTRGALRGIYRLTGGIPRLINIICDRALLGAYSRGLKQVNRATLRRAARETLPGPAAGATALRPRPVFVIAGVAVAALAAGWYWPGWVPALPALETAASFATLSPAPSERPARVTQTFSPPALDARTAPAVQAMPEDIEALLADTPAADDALARLLSLWGEKGDTSSGIAPCEQVKRYNLRCLTGRADWEELRRYNRPALLNLVLGQATVRQVVLRSLEGQTATLDLAGRSVQTELARLEPLWSGDYLLLWRPQTGPALIGPGATGEPVTWLRQRLALAEGRDPGQEPPLTVFDLALKERVQDFQRANALQPDGVVGQRTMALLSNLAPGPGTPLLTAPATAKVN